jgi:hypothetical protein
MDVEGRDVDANNHIKSIGDIIKEEICNRDLTAYSLSKMTGVSAVTIQRFLTGERGLTLSTVEKLTAALELELCRRARPGPNSELGHQDDGADEDRTEGLRTFNVGQGSRILIGSRVVIEVVSISRNSVRLKVICDPDVAVIRGETLQAASGGART